MPKKLISPSVSSDWAQPVDVDAELLRDIARRGEGRVFFTQNAQELPRLFAQDTFVVARSTFIEELTTVRTTGGMVSLIGRGAPDTDSNRWV